MVARRCRRHHLSRTGQPKPTRPPQLLTWDQVPSWYAQTDRIRTGFRPVTQSTAECLASLAYLHNESVNIYSHLIPSLVFLVAAVVLFDVCLFTPLMSSRWYPGASWLDILMIRFFLFTSAVCFGVSAVYHVLVCHSRAMAERWVRLDYAAIVLQIWGSFLSGLYMCFYCEPGLRNGYWAMITTLSVITALIVLDARLQSLQWRMLRLWAFVATGLSAFAPIAHAVLIFPYGQLDKQSGLRYYYLEGVFILLGAVVYATHWPESSRPNKYDIWGASHQLFHVLVVLGALAHLYGIFSAFDWNYRHPRCPVPATGQES
ncbi:mPR-like GPCR protein [Microdochium trichocladiopsis]|uniref:MPR-like GPCR protein n=1 Tax=Microdochium trichocladiopsis TaxID=1682393 RepID=A0A9P8XZ51_9PEZI|nr:mPR-like GPCR protein [Microdochium trichocladiopsis]KAH7025834.1 mPR-like GPCR protein [Microdochium trichocladiopsis]